jgi:hypothetical protein
VAAPWGVVLDKDILGLVLDDLLPVLSDQDSESTLLLWDGLTLEVRLELSFSELAEEGGHAANTEMVDVSIPVVLEHALAS